MVWTPGTDRRDEVIGSPAKLDSAIESLTKPVAIASLLFEENLQFMRNADPCVSIQHLRKQCGAAAPGTDDESDVYWTLLRSRFQ